jgi:polysaccharide biosynthesis transport protein
MDAAQAWSTLRGRWKLALSLLAGTTLLVLAAGLSQPPQYLATATLLMDPRTDPLAASPAATPSGATALAALAEIVRSERVARRVLAELPAPVRAAWVARWQADTEGSASPLALEPWLLAQWSRRLELRPLRDSGVLALAFRADSAEEAADMANAWVAASVAVALALRVEPARQYAGFFEAQAAAARNTLEAAQARLAEHQRQHGLVVASDRLDLEQARLEDLSRQVALLQQQTVDSASRQRQASGGQAEGLQEVLNNAAVSQLKGELARTEAQLGQLATRLGDQHPQLTALAAQRDELRARLEAETRRVASGLGLANRINQQREAETRAALAAQRERFLALKTQRDEALVLQREVEQAQRSFDSLLQRRSQSELEGGATRAPMSVLSPATAPARAASPQQPVLLALALLLGSVIATAGTLALETRRRRVRSAHDVERELGLPVLGVLSPLHTRGA